MSRLSSIFLKKPQSLEFKPPFLTETGLMIPITYQCPYITQILRRRNRQRVPTVKMVTIWERTFRTSTENDRIPDNCVGTCLVTPITLPISLTNRHSVYQWGQTHPLTHPLSLLSYTSFYLWTFSCTRSRSPTLTHCRSTVFPSHLHIHNTPPTLQPTL